MKLPLALVLLLAAVALQAQYDETAQVRLNGFGGPFFQVTHFDGDPAVMIGGCGALLIQERVYVGAFGQGMVGTVDRQYVDSSGGGPAETIDLDLGFSQFGGWAGWFINPANKVQATINALVGFGKVKPRNLDVSDRIWVLGPYAGVQYAATDWMRVELHAGYRLTRKVNEGKVVQALIDNGDLSAPFGGLTFRFGGFE